MGEPLLSAPNSHSLRYVLFAVLALLGSILAMEALFRTVLGAPWFFESPEFEESFLIPHPVRGYSLRPNARVRGGREGWEIEVAINSAGLRDGPLEESRSSPHKVLAVGDSFTLGLGVSVRDAWPQRLEDRLRSRMDVSVINAGVPAYSARQMRQMADEWTRRLKPEVIVFAIYASSWWRVENPYRLIGSHLVSGIAAPNVSLDGRGGLVVTRFRPGPFRELDLWSKRHLYLAAHLLSIVHGLRHWPEFIPQNALRETSEVRADFEPVFREILLAQHDAEAQDARLVVMAINGQEEDGRFAEIQSRYNAVLSEFCLEHGIVFVDPLSELIRRSGGAPIFRLGTDMHWSPAAHEVAAEVLAASLEAGAGGESLDARVP